MRPPTSGEEQVIIILTGRRRLLRADGDSILAVTSDVCMEVSMVLDMFAVRRMRTGAAGVRVAARRVGPVATCGWRSVRAAPLGAWSAERCRLVNRLRPRRAVARRAQGCGAVRYLASISGRSPIRSWDHAPRRGATTPHTYPATMVLTGSFQPGIAWAVRVRSPSMTPVSQRDC